MSSETGMEYALRVVESPQDVLKYVEHDGEQVLFVSRDKVMDKYGLDEEKAQDVVELAEEKLGWEKSQDLSREERELLSNDPNSYWDRVKRGFQRQKKAWLVPGNFLAGIIVGAFIELWYVQAVAFGLVAGDIIAAWFHGRIDIDGN